MSAAKNEPPKQLKKKDAVGIIIAVVLAAGIVGILLITMYLKKERK